MSKSQEKINFSPPPPPPNSIESEFSMKNTDLKNNNIYFGIQIFLPVILHTYLYV